MTVLRGEDLTSAVFHSETDAGVEFRLGRLLGVGATAAAYLAKRITARGECLAVVKVIRPEIAAASGHAATTLVSKEAVALGRLNERVPPTPFVIRLMDVGAIEWSGSLGRLALPWLALEYVHGGPEGTTLEDRIDFTLAQTGIAFDRERAARFVAHVTAGLTEVHEVGVVHRDINPNNILCCGSGDRETFKLSDFGIARPSGMTATLSTGALGTPGYMAPEQAVAPAQVTCAADVFGVACLIYYVLTGEHYFQGSHPLTTVFGTESDVRRSLLDAHRLCPSLREDEEACRAIDRALARATQANPSVRPENAKALAASIAGWISGGEVVAPSSRYLFSLMATPDPLPDATWTVLYPSGQDDLALFAVGWDGDAHCLAASAQGLVFWNGSEWRSAASNDVTTTSAARAVRRLAPGRWLIGSAGGVLAEYSRGGLNRILRHPARALTFVDVGGELSDLAVAAGEESGSPPVPCGIVAGRFLKPLPVPQAASLRSLARLDDTRWLVAGRRHDGFGLVGIYSPLEWELELLSVPQCRAYVATSSALERGHAVAVGGQGSVVELGAGRPLGSSVPARVDLASVAVDLLGRVWVGGLGEIWLRMPGQAEWARVWHDPRWEVPFISLSADLGRVVAVTADGGVLECRTQLHVAAPQARS